MSRKHLTMILIVLMLISHLSIPRVLIKGAPDASFKQILKIGDGSIQALNWVQKGKVLLVSNGLQITLYSPELKKLATFDADGHAITAMTTKDFLIAVGADDGSIRVWNVDTLKLTARFEGHSARINTLSFSPDTSFVVSGSDDKTMRIWNTLTQKSLFILKDHAAVVTSVTVDTKNGERILSYDAAYVLNIWNAKTSKLLKTIQAPVSSWRIVTWDSEIRYVVTNVEGSNNNELKLYKLLENKSVTLKTGYSNVPTEARFSPDGQKLFTMSRYTGEGTITDLKTLKPTRNISIPPDSLSVYIFTSDSQRVLIGSKTGQVFIEPVAGGAEVWFVAYESGLQYAIDGGDGRIITTNTSGQVNLWNKDGTPSQSFDNSPDVYSLLFAPDDSILILADSTGKITLLKDLKQVATVQGFSTISTRIVWSPDGTKLVSSGRDRVLHIWDATTGKELSQLAGHTLAINTIAWSPDGKYILSGSSDNTARLWDADTGKEIRQIGNFADGIYSVAFSSDNERIAIGSRQTSQRLGIYTLDGKQVVNFGKELPNTPLSIAWNPTNPNLVLAGVFDGSIALVDLSMPLNSPLKLSKSHTSSVNGLAWSPDGKQFATVGNDNTLRFWNANTLIVQQTITQDRTSRTVSWSKDGMLIATNSGNNIKVSDVTGNPVALIVGHVSSVNDANWSPDGTLLASASQDGTIRIWSKNP